MPVLRNGELVDFDFPITSRENAVKLGMVDQFLQALGAPDRRTDYLEIESLKHWAQNRVIITRHHIRNVVDNFSQMANYHI